MRIIPVIDLKGGVVVRGVGGRRDEYRPIVSKIVVDAQPVTVAQAFVERGLQEVYLADLDAIAGSEPAWEIYKLIMSSGLRLLVDAGLNCENRAEKLASFETQSEALAGIVVGLESINDPAMIRRCLHVINRERCVFSLDLKNGVPLTSVPDWQNSNPLAIVEDVLRFGIQRIIVLDLANVGENKGVGTESLCRQIRELDATIEIIAGGGVRDANDVKSLKDAGCNAALVASALHDGRML